MIPVAFEYARAESVEEAVRLARESGDDASFIAGGQSVIPLLRHRLARPELLIDVSGLDALRYLRLADGRLHIGALTRHADLARNLLVAQHLPLLQKVAVEIGDRQVRNRGTIGGSIAHADPAADYGSLCLVLGAEFVTSQRTIAAQDFYVGPYTTVLEHGEMLTEVIVPVRNGPHSYLRFSKRLPGWAIIAVAVQQSTDGWRIGLTNVAPKPTRAPAAEAALAAGSDFSEAAALASDGLNPSGGMRATPEFCLHLTRVLTQRALERAAAS